MTKNEIFCKDANQLVREIEADVFYIDPPYREDLAVDAAKRILLQNLLKDYVIVV